MCLNFPEPYMKMLSFSEMLAAAHMGLRHPLLEREERRSQLRDLKLILGSAEAHMTHRGLHEFQFLESETRHTTLSGAFQKRPSTICFFDRVPVIDGNVDFV